MTLAIDDRSQRSTRAGRIATPNALLLLTVLLLAVLLSVRIFVPVGPMFWDSYLYYDAANRIWSGQIPGVDFFTPVGALGYYLFALTSRLFPNAQTALLTHWTLLLVTAPLMALVLADVSKRSRATGFAILVPFLVYAVLPFNTREYYPFPGSDGFGVYNRQVTQLIYVMVAALMFVRNARLVAGLVCATMLSLFFTKITGFVSGVMICLFAVAAGRLSWRGAIAAGLGFVAVLALLQLTLGLTLAYVEDILLLVSMNSGTLLPRVLQSMSHNFGVLAPGGALVVVLAYAERDRLRKKWSSFRAKPGWTTATAFFDQNAFWLAAVLFANMFFETQNTGSQAMISTWLPVLAILLRATGLINQPKLLAAVVVLGLAAVLPGAVDIVERAARTYAGAIKNSALESRNLKTIGDLTMRPDVRDRLAKMIPFFQEHRATYDQFAAMSELPSPIFYSDYDFQLAYLKTIDAAIEDIQRLEAESGVRFETVMHVSFANLFPYLMDRQAPKHLSIGADPTRTVPPLDAEARDAVSNTDLVMIPTCPATSANAELMAIYAPALTQHHRITVNGCYDALVHPRLAEQLQ